MDQNAAPVVTVQIFYALLPVLLALLGVLAAFVARWVNANVKNTYLRGVLLRLDDAVYTVVKEVNQTVVDAARQPDGSLAPDAAVKAQAAALVKVKSYLGANGLKLLSQVAGIGASTDAIITSKIEAAVSDLKLAKTSVEAAVPSPAALSGLPASR